MTIQATSSQSLPNGTRIEEFSIERVLGSGGFGITYLARDVSLNRQVVIKENLPAQFCFRDTHSLTVAPRHTHGGDTDDFQWSMNNFLREAEMLASLDHPGIVRVLRKFEANGTAYFVMPFVEGVAFDELIIERMEEGLAFTDEELRGLLARLLDALAYLHARGIYHRDIKPGNILISNEGVPALIDFGSARQRLSERSMTVVESAGYTPFEQLQTRGNVGPWSDLYALGAMMEKAITSEAPPKAADRIGRDPRVPLATRQDVAGRLAPALVASIDRALEVDAKKRWQSAGQWQEALATGQMTRPNAPTEQRSTRSFPDPMDEWERKNRVAEVAQSPAWNEEEPPDSHESEESASQNGRSRRGLVTLVAGIVVVAIGGWTVSESRRKSSELAATLAAEAAATLAAETSAAQAREAEQRAAQAEKEKLALIERVKAKEESEAKEAEKQNAARVAQEKQELIAKAKEEHEAKEIEKQHAVQKEQEIRALSTQIKEKEDAAATAEIEKRSLTGSQAGEEREFEIAPNVKMNFCWIPPGEFTMGSPVSERYHYGDETQQRVTISKGFWLAKTEITQAQWKAVMGNNPSDFKGNDLPVEKVSWHDSQNFISKANGRERMPKGLKFALPTEAQWEYACRAGQTGPYSGGSLEEVAWYWYTSDRKTHKVGTKQANAWGLHDMHGNVWEWCADWYAEMLSGGIDPRGPNAGPYRVVRGGSWSDEARSCRAATRGNGYSPRITRLDFGFRVAGIPAL